MSLPHKDVSDRMTLYSSLGSISTVTNDCKYIITSYHGSQNGRNLRRLRGFVG